MARMPAPPPHMLPSSPLPKSSVSFDSASTPASDEEKHVFVILMGGAETRMHWTGTMAMTTPMTPIVSLSRADARLFNSEDEARAAAAAVSLSGPWDVVPVEDFRDVRERTKSAPAFP